MIKSARCFADLEQPALMTLWFWVAPLEEKGIKNIN